jgi:hypothetical protein
LIRKSKHLFEKYKKYAFSCFTTKQQLIKEIEKAQNYQLPSFRILIFYNEDILAIFDDKKMLIDYNIKSNNQAALIIIDKKIGDKWESELIDKENKNLNKDNKKIRNKGKSKIKKRNKN